jgi:hypothetical protein
MNYNPHNFLSNGKKTAALSNKQENVKSIDSFHKWPRLLLFLSSIVFTIVKMQQVVPAEDSLDNGDNRIKTPDIIAILPPIAEILSELIINHFSTKASKDVKKETKKLQNETSFKRVTSIGAELRSHLEKQVNLFPRTLKMPEKKNGKWIMHEGTGISGETTIEEITKYREELHKKTDKIHDDIVWYIDISKYTAVAMDILVLFSHISFLFLEDSKTKLEVDFLIKTVLSGLSFIIGYTCENFQETDHKTLKEANEDADEAYEIEYNFLR